MNNMKSYSTICQQIGMPRWLVSAHFGIVILALGMILILWLFGR